MQTSRIYRIFIIAGILSLSVAYVGIWQRFISDPVERTGSDFIAFFSAGRVAQEKGFSQVYDPLLQQAVEEKEVGFHLVKGQVLLYNHLPFLIPLLCLLVNEDYVSSFYRWVSLLIAIYIAALTILSKTLNIANIAKQTIWIMGIGAFLFLPLFVSLINGQDTAILFLGTALWIYGLISGKEMIAGLGLVLTTVRPHVSIALAIPMLFRYRRVFIYYLIGSGLLALASVLIVGLEGARAYIHILLISVGGEWHGMKEEAMFNLIGILIRIVPWLGIEMIHGIVWAVYGITILLLTFLWTQQKILREHLISLTVILALFASPHLHFHDLTLLLVPYYALTYSGAFHHKTATVLPIAASLLLLISNTAVFLQYTTPYVIMFALAIFPFYAKEKPALARQHQAQLPER